MSKGKGGSAAAAFEDAYETNVPATFLSSEDKGKLAMSGKPFTLVSVTTGKIERQSVWRAHVQAPDLDGVLTFSASAGRDEGMENLASIIKKHGPIPNCALAVFGRNTKSKSASYVIVPRTKWNKPQVLPSGGGARRRKAA